MCGICGYININNNNADENILKNMLNRIIHRGPDSEGSIVEKNVAIGMRRLKIIDIVRGDQPIFNEKKDVLIVFNGEIYNFLELRKELISKGHSFVTNCDTEVIVHLYEEEGLEFINKLNGMFSFCIWDKRKGCIIFARDRFGKKPLHYSFNNGTFIFGSEIKSLFEHPDIEKKIVPLSAKKYFFYGYVPAPDTIFKGIYKLMPGEYLILDSKGKINKNYYWKPKFNEKSTNFENLVKQTETLLSESIKRRSPFLDKDLSEFAFTIPINSGLY